MKRFGFILYGFLLFSFAPKAQESGLPEFRKGIPLDSIVLSDPFILADGKTNRYYMTGTGGLVWKSNNLKN